MHFPVENPVLIFAILLLTILLSAILLRRFKVPYIVGMIVAGILLGPKGFGVLARDSSVELYGTVGLLYIMFLSGVEVDMLNSQRNKRAIVGFGMFTFLIPMLLGFASSMLLLDMDAKTAVLLASLYASHTLIAYPIVSKFGIAKIRAVNIAVVGTVITNVLSLLVFAVIESSYLGNDSFLHWIGFGASVLAFGAVIMFGFPWVALWFFKKYTDNVTQYIFVLALMLLAAFLAQIVGIEGIIGAFLAGIALNKLIPGTSALMNRLDFVGNAIFIPFFLIGVGMLVDVRVFTEGREALGVAAIMTVVATTSKYLAALATRKAFKLEPYEGNLIFGLSNAQAAATLAVVTVCHQAGWLNDAVLNGSIVMIFFTCLISSITVEKATRDILAKKEVGKQDKHRGAFLISMSNPQTIDSLIALARMVRNPKNRRPLLALYVEDKQNVDESTPENRHGKEILERAAKIASGSDTPLKTILRQDDTVATGIVRTAEEQNVNDIILGVGTSNLTSAMFNIDINSVLRRTHQMVMLARLCQPLNTIRRIVVTVPPQAEYEPGFSRWLYRLSNLHRQTSAQLVFYAPGTTVEKIQILNARNEARLKIQCHKLEEQSSFLSLAGSLKDDDLVTCILARRDSLSYSPEVEQIPSLLSNYFRQQNILMIYPEQYQSADLQNKFMG